MPFFFWRSLAEPMATFTRHGRVRGGVLSISVDMMRNRCWSCAFRILPQERTTTTTCTPYLKPRFSFLQRNRKGNRRRERPPECGISCSTFHKPQKCYTLSREWVRILGIFALIQSPFPGTKNGITRTINPPREFYVNHRGKTLFCACFARMENE